MGWLPRIVAYAILRRVHAWSGEACRRLAAAAPQASPPAAAPGEVRDARGAPPAHWLALVGRQAPWLLEQLAAAGQRPGRVAPPGAPGRPPGRGPAADARRARAPAGAPGGGPRTVPSAATLRPLAPLPHVEPQRAGARPDDAAPAGSAAIPDRVRAPAGRRSEHRATTGIQPLPPPADDDARDDDAPGRHRQGPGGGQGVDDAADAAPRPVALAAGPVAADQPAGRPIGPGGRAPDERWSGLTAAARAQAASRPARPAAPAALAVPGMAAEPDATSAGRSQDGATRTSGHALPGQQLQDALVPRLAAAIPAGQDDGRVRGPAAAANGSTLRGAVTADAGAAADPAAHLSPAMVSAARQPSPSRSPNQAAAWHPPTGVGRGEPPFPAAPARGAHEWPAAPVQHSRWPALPDEMASIDHPAASGPTAPGRPAGSAGAASERWPELPDSREERQDDDLEPAAAALAQRRRLDEEQRGQPWNA